MKKTLTVNLGGVVFHIDEDAYRLLDEYLHNLQHHFRKQEGADEIIHDIEIRISELFSEKIGLNIQVITIAHVEEVIERMGKPEDFDGEAKHSSAYSSPKERSEPKKQKRLYRNPDDKILGGVIGGIAAYIGWDVTWLRLLIFFVMICGVGTLIPIYIVCWLIIPEAKTAAEKLGMRGEDVTMENIGKTVKEGFDKVAADVNDFVHSEKPRTALQKVADVFVAVVGLFLKVCLAILAIVFSPVLFALVVVFIVLVIVIFSVMISGGTILYKMLPDIDWNYVSTSPVLMIVACIAGVIVVGIPLYGLIFSVLRYVFKWQPMIPGLKWSLLITWVIGLIVFLLALPEINNLEFII